MYTEQRTQAAPPPSQPSPRNRLLLFAAGGVLVLLCLCVAVIGVFLLLDPFNLDLLARLMGGYDPVAETVPADAAAYVSIDLVKLKSDDALAIFNAFAEASDSDIETSEDAADEIDQMLEGSDSGISFTEDIQPWVGQYAGLALLDVESGEYGPENAEVLLTVETRDGEATDQFIEKFIDYLEEDSGMQFDDKDVDGGVIYEAESDYGESLALGRIGNYFYIGTNANVIEDALDRPEESLADDPVYRTAMAQLPRERAVTLYFNEASFEPMAQVVGNAYGYYEQDINPDEMFPLEGMAMSLTVAHERIYVDAVTVYQEDGLNEDQVAMLSNPTHDVRFASYFPEDTFVMVMGSHIDLAWEAVRDNMANFAGKDEWDRTMQDLEDQVGFNLEDDLIANLDGAWAVGMYPNSDGYWAEQGSAPMGLLFLAETSDAGALANVAQSSADAISDSMGQYGSVEHQTANGIEYYDVRDQQYGTMWAFGTSDAFALVSTDTDQLTEALSRTSSLANDDQFTNTWSAFPAEMVPAMYLNMEGFVNFMDESNPYDDDYDPYAALSPLRTIAFAREPLTSDLILHSRVVIVVETGED